MKVLVCGGRQFDDVESLASRLSEIHRDQGITEIIEGGAVGADTLAREFGEHRGIPVRTFPADWDTHGRAAGPIRNRQMLEEGRPDLVARNRLASMCGAEGSPDSVYRDSAFDVLTTPTLDFGLLVAP